MNRVQQCITWLASVTTKMTKKLQDRIIRDVLIIECSLTHAKDKIIRKGSAMTLKDVFKILQVEESTSKTLQSEPIKRTCTMPGMTGRNQAPRVDRRTIYNPLHRRKQIQNQQMDQSAITARNPTLKAMSNVELV